MDNSVAAILLRLVIAGVVMGIIDAFWLVIVSNKFYKSQIGSLLLKKPNMAAALLFYVIYICGVVGFVITPALNQDSWKHALVFGLFFGLVAYATYDLTNRSTLKGFTTKLVFVDMLWGMFLTAVVSVATFAIIKL